MDDSGSRPNIDEDRWNRLTEKQRACLDLLIEHKTSKEIARLLDISKHTVDQRLNAARDTLGARDRNETAFLYGQLKQIYDRMTYDAVEVPGRPTLVRSEFPDGSPPNLMELHESSNSPSASTGIGFSFRDLLRPDYGVKQRVTIVAALFIVAVIAILGGIGIGQGLTQLVSN